LVSTGFDEVAEIDVTRCYEFGDYLGLVFELSFVCGGFGFPINGFKL
jgi:hypothetical protein